MPLLMVPDTGSGNWYWPTSSTQTATTTITVPIAWITTTATTTTATTITVQQPTYAIARWYSESTDQYIDQYGTYGTVTESRSLAVMRRPRPRTQEEIARRDQELYQRAVAEHDTQEAERIARMIAARQAEQERNREEQVQRDAARRLAHQRANEFLLEHLTPRQMETFNKHGWFVVEGGRSKNKYRIRAVESMVANVDVLNKKDDSLRHRLCGHIPHHQVPLGDQLLAQKMMLEFSEDDFLRIANRH